MARTPIWMEIDRTLRAEIAGGQYRPGERLPTEAALSVRFGVHRHTVRRALAAMQNDGIVHSRRGSGVFVAIRPTEYPIRSRVRFHEILEAAGQSAEKQFLRLETRAADARESEALALRPGEDVHVSEGIAIADGAPLALFRNVFPAARLPGFLAGLLRTRSVTAALMGEGIEDYTRASTRLSAERATATQALHLRIGEGAPLLRAISINVDPEGRPVEYGRTWFAGDRVQLIFEPSR